ncbi:MAG: flagellar hook-basal body complex protein [Alphaproteobacteria bacterium]|nr:flagellar hook-basal body complex protein [Alphaproteobacteria bacterium]
MASLFSALTVAVGGLTAQSSALGNISDNLANAQTVAYKSIGTQFESLVTQSNSSFNNPGGVRATPQYQNDVQGNLIQSATPTSLSITGQGFFAVESATINADGSTSFNGNVAFTRRGDFTLDKSGFLVNGAGFYLTGYTVDTEGNVDTSTTAPIEVSALLNDPVPSSSVSYSANLPSSADVNFTSNPSTLKIFDALGNTHDMTFTWTKDAANNWTLDVVVEGGGGTVSTSSGPVSADFSVSIPFVFNDTTNIGTVDSITSGSAYTVVDNTSSAVNAAQVQFDLDFSGIDIQGLQSLTLNFGAYDTTSGLTQFADTAVTVTSFSQNGLPRGSFTNLSIDQNGFVSLNYNNGSLKTIAQVPIVQFFAQNQLQRISGGAYLATLASGTPRYSAPGTTGAGVITSSSLESSNVDIAAQFTDMIQAQQIYSANSKTITTINNMLNTIINAV